jgi:hypothetical protein
MGGKVLILGLVVLGISAGGVFFTEHVTARRCTDPKNACINNLRQIDGAKEQWAMENGRKEGGDVMVAEMVVYIKGAKLPVCPQKGIYSVGKVGEPVVCSVAGHTLN